MNSLSIVVFCVAVACASASLIHGGLVGHGVSDVLAGPAGTVVRHGGPAGPTVSISAVPAIAAHGAVIGAPGLLGAGLLGHAGLIGHAGILGHGLVGSGIEGQWIPDINEHLYDDGSYKPHIYGH